MVNLLCSHHQNQASLVAMEILLVLVNTKVVIISRKSPQLRLILLIDQVENQSRFLTLQHQVWYPNLSFFFHLLFFLSVIRAFPSLASAKI